MAKFIDKEKDVWVIALDLRTMRRVRDVLDVDLLKLDQALIEKLTGDIYTLVDVLWLVCEEQADKRHVDDQKFGELLSDGDVIEAASTALLEGIVDFFPEARRVPMRRALVKIAEIQDRAGQCFAERLNDGRVDELITKLLEEAETQIDDALDRAIAELIPGEKSTDSPASSESPTSEV